MICDECGKDNATFKLVVFMGGQRTERHLCPECMEKQKRIHAGEVRNLLSTLLQTAQPSQTKPAASEEEKKIACPKCGTTFERFKKGSPLGCAECYQTFRKPMEQFLNRVNGCVRHTGRIPQTEGAPAAGARHEQTLRREMELAIACEDFERAAEIRDELKKIAESAAEKEKEGESIHA